MRLRLIERLDEEGAEDLADKLRPCGEVIRITCTHCGDMKNGYVQCKKKWCPACQRSLAAKRSCRLRGAIKRFEYPLFVTLTMANSDSPEDVRKLRQCFGKLRNRRLWKETVKGGVAAVEVTNTGKGWHPHIHALVDCRWLAIQTPEPPRTIPREDKRVYYESARRELSDTWAHILGQEKAIVLAKREKGEDVIQEIIKYSIKGSDLIDSPDPIAPMLRMLDMTRLITTFGSLYGKSKELDEEEANEGCPCGECGAIGAMMPDYLVQYLIRS